MRHAPVRRHARVRLGCRGRRGGHRFGNASPRADIPKLLRLYRQGELLLDELVTRTYRLHEVNEGYQDMRAHRNVRGMIRYP